MKLQDLKMRPKLIGLFVITGLIPLVAIGLWSSKLVNDALIKRLYGQLEAVREVKKTQIQKIFSEYESDMEVLVETVNTFKQQANKRLAFIQESKKITIESYFQRMKSEVISIKNNNLIICKTARTIFSSAIFINTGIVK